MSCGETIKQEIKQEKDDDNDSVISLGSDDEDSNVESDDYFLEESDNNDSYDTSDESDEDYIPDPKGTKVMAS